jgi:hypothetical protein
LKELLIEDLPRATLGNSHMLAHKYLRVACVAQRPAPCDAAPRNVAQPSMYRKHTVREHARTLIQAQTITINELTNSIEETLFHANL